MKYLKGILLPALLALAPFATARDEPTVDVQKFDGELVNIFYFDDSETALLAEVPTSKVYRSTDAGKSWDAVKDLRTVGIIKNPFDNQVAVVLGETKHWITYNQGEDWTEFHTQFGPSLFGQPLSFNAKDSKKVLYHEIEDCFTAPCLGRVSLDIREYWDRIADSANRRTTPKTASSRNRRSCARTGKCACGRRAPSASSWTRASTTIAYCV